MIYSHPGITVLWLITAIATAGTLASDYSKSGPLSLKSYFIYLFMVFPILLQYPFLLDNAQLDAIGIKSHDYVYTIGLAASISLTGILSTLAGLLILPKLINIRSTSQRRTLSYAIAVPWSSPEGSLGLFLLTFLLYLILIASGMSLTNGRGTVFLNPALRPIFNLWYVLVPLSSIFINTAAITTRNKYLYGCVAITLIMGLSSGTRSTTIFAIMQLVLMYVLTRKTKTNTIGLIIAGILILAGAQLTAALRQVHSDNQNGFIASFIYGNTFSDLRDFGWVLTGFNKQFYYGLTYLSGILSGMPGILSDIRENYKLGIVTLDLAGFHINEASGQFHAGLRPTIFGEAYLNFGFPGVIFIGLATGLWIDRLQREIDRSTRKNSKNSPIIVASSMISLLFLQSILITAAFFRFYVLIALAILGSTLPLIMPKSKKPGNDARVKPDSI